MTPDHKERCRSQSGPAAPVDPRDAEIAALTERLTRLEKLAEAQIVNSVVETATVIVLWMIIVYLMWRD